jgi:uncharacterized membrane protein (DUF441 family)
MCNNTKNANVILSHCGIISENNSLTIAINIANVMNEFVMYFLTLKFTINACFYE